MLDPTKYQDVFGKTWVDRQTEPLLTLGRRSWTRYELVSKVGVGNSGLVAIAAPLGDFIRGIDADAFWSGLDGAQELLNRAIDQQIPLRIKFKWEAFDRNGFEQEGGRRLVRKSPEEKELRKKCTISGMRNFSQNPDGSYRPTVEGPVSGEMLEAQLVIDRVIPSSKVRR